MRRWIKVEIEVQDNDTKRCSCSCPFEIISSYVENGTDDDLKICDAFNLEEQMSGSFGKRCQDCLDADITDIISENEALKKRIAVLERVIEND